MPPCPLFSVPRGFALSRFTVRVPRRRFPTMRLALLTLKPSAGATGSSADGAAKPTEPYRFANRPQVLRCRKCQRDNALTAGTVMERTRTPLSVWFWAAYLVSSHTPGISPAWLEPLRDGVPDPPQTPRWHGPTRSRPHRWPAAGSCRDRRVWVGGRTRGEGRGVHNQSLVIAAVEVRQRKPENVTGVPRRNGRYAGRIRMEVVPDRSARSLCGFVEAAVEPGAVVVTDAWGGYATLSDRGYRHLPVAAQGDPSVPTTFCRSPI